MENTPTQLLGGYLYIYLIFFSLFQITERENSLILEYFGRQSVLFSKLSRGAKLASEHPAGIFELGHIWQRRVEKGVWGVGGVSLLWRQ